MIKVRGYIPELDGIRGLAILMVLIAHFNGEAILQAYFPIAGPIFTKLVLNGLWGVDLFFILSGFLITGILLDTKGSEGFFTNFYARRVLRIFPLYYGVLFFLFWVLPVFISLDAGALELSEKQWWFWLYFQNFPGHPDPDSSNLFHLGHLWSLAVEEHFYLVWPFVVFLLPSNRLKKLCLFWLVISVSAGMVSLFTVGWISHTLRWSTICFSGSLTLGAYFALVAREEPGLERFVPYAKKVALVFGFIFFALGMIPRRLHFDLVTMVQHYVSWIFFAALIIIVLTSSRDNFIVKFFCSEIMKTFGKFSYGLYIYHGALRPVLERYFDREILIQMVGSPLVGVMLYFILSIGISFGISWLSWHVYEKQFLKLKKFFKSSRRSSQSVVLAESGT